MNTTGKLFKYFTVLLEHHFKKPFATLSFIENPCPHIHNVPFIPSDKLFFDPCLSLRVRYFLRRWVWVFCFNSVVGRFRIENVDFFHVYGQADFLVGSELEWRQALCLESAG
jgi:hypothetical protein